MDQLALIQQIYQRLASLEQDREKARTSEESTDVIDVEMAYLRMKLQDVMNKVCPVIKSHTGDSNVGQ